jgi:LuxR family maltose regulon positive regulatory protein
MQQHSLLQTKLHIPPVRPKLVARPRLIERLNAGLTTRGGFARALTLISAPAGFGKTTLLSEWIRASDGATPPIAVAWLSLDEGDNDPNRFLAYLIAALQTTKSSLGQGLVQALQSAGTADVESVLTTLINESANLSGHTALILDDYHLIESQPVDDVLTFLLEHLPRKLHLVIASRIDPSLPLSRLRARGHMTEIREIDLRFTSDEAAAFLDQVMGLELSTENVAALESRTEGWIAGLQLAALSMQGLKESSDITDFVTRFTGSDRYIQDYLTDEVLQRRPKGTKQFLLETSILDRLSGPLCDALRFGRSETPKNSEETAITSREDSQSILEALDAANLFIVPMDNERRWYRYHHLFASLMRQRLRWTMPEQVPKLHRRASSWHEMEGHFDDAFRHALEAGNRERAAGLIEEHWQEIVHRGELTKLEGMLDSLGPGLTKKSAPLSMAYCWTHVLRGHIDPVPTLLQDVRDALAVTTDVESARQPMSWAVIPSLVETIEASISLDRKQATQAKEHAMRAIDLIPAEATASGRGLLHGAAAYRLARAHRELGEHSQACLVLLEVLVMLKASENYYGVAGTVLQITSMYHALGRTVEAIALCEDTLVYMKEHQWEHLLPTGMVHVALAGLQADVGELEEAKKNLEVGRGPVEQIQSQELLSLVRTIEGKLAVSTAPPQPLIEPLTPRELEILRLLARGLSNREICERLFLALSTVKGYNRTLYGKLQVRRRTEAVARARELGLLQ